MDRHLKTTAFTTRDASPKPCSARELNRKPDLSLADIRRKEIYRYLRLEDHAPDAATKDDVERNLLRLIEKISLRLIASIRPILRTDDQLCFGDFSTQSVMLRKNMKTSDYAVLFAMTLGADVDRLISRLLITSKADAFITDACATECLESYANRYAAQIAADAGNRGFSTHPRFSPGFADFGLEHQWPLIRTLQADKKIHIALTVGNMLVPTKTITALIGLDGRNR